MPTLDQTFNTLLERYGKAIEKDTQARLGRARDKMFTLKEIEKGERFMLGILKGEKHKNDFIKVFSVHYKRGETIEFIFNLLKNTYGEIEDIRPFKLKENGQEMDIYITGEEKELKNIARDERKMLRLFVRYLAHTDLKKRLVKLKQEIAGDEPLGKLNVNYIIRWTGEKNNKNEFVQLIYALHQAKLINEGKGEITRIVETLAEAFNLQLGHNWQSNLSGSIHKRNRDYEPPIFKTIERAYKDYTSHLLNEKLQNKEK